MIWFQIPTPTTQFCISCLSFLYPSRMNTEALIKVEQLSILTFHLCHLLLWGTWPNFLPILLLIFCLFVLLCLGKFLSLVITIGSSIFHYCLDTYLSLAQIQGFSHFLVALNCSALSVKYFKRCLAAFHSLIGYRHHSLFF